MAHACDPSHSGGRDQEGCSSKPGWAHSARDLSLKKLITRKADGVAQGVGPEFTPRNATTTKKELRMKNILNYI
jgi:hypothetical protein